MYEKLVWTLLVLPQKKPCQINSNDFLDLDKEGNPHAVGKTTA